MEHWYVFIRDTGLYILFCDVFVIMIMVHSLFMVYSYNLVAFRFWFIVLVLVSGYKVLQFRLRFRLMVKDSVFRI